MNPQILLITLTILITTVNGNPDSEPKPKSNLNILITNYSSIFPSVTSDMMGKISKISRNKEELDKSDQRSRRSLNEESDSRERNPCSKTLFGEVGSKYPLRITDQIQRFEEFKCRINFSASGNKFGDRIELTFLSFQVGTLEYNQKEQTWNCPKGHLKLWEEKLIQKWEETEREKSKKKTFKTFSTTTTTKSVSSSSNESAPSIPSSSTSFSFLHPSSPSSSSSSSSSSLSSSTFSSSSSGTFCGQMMSRKTVFYSTGRNVSLNVYLPPGRALFGHSVPFNLFLTYRFLPVQKMMNPKNDGRTKDEDETSIDYGTAVQNTNCDKTFTNCLTSKKCIIRSPNHPGFYNGNITCNYFITQYKNVPPGFKAYIIVSQANEYKISLPSPASINSGSSSNGPSSKSSTRLSSECLSTDRIEVRDGRDSNPSTSKLLSSFCGSGSLNNIISSGSELVVTLYSMEFKPMFESKIELEIIVQLIKETTSMFRTSGNCDSIYEGDLMRFGLIHSPLQTVPFNTNCFYQFLSNKPEDRIWIQFISYFVQDLNQWSSEQSCDVSSLSIDGIIDTSNLTTKSSSAQSQNKPNSMTLILPPNSNSNLSTMNSPIVKSPTVNSPKICNSLIDASRNKNLVETKVKFCEKSSPKVCGRLLKSADSSITPSVGSPCTLSESYLSTGPSITISQSVFKTLDAVSRFEARFEFVDTKEIGEIIEGTICDRIISSHISKSGKIRSSKNVFLYGRGGQTSLKCEYKFNQSTDSNERIRIKLDSFYFNSTNCETKRDIKNENIFKCIHSSNSHSAISSNVHSIPNGHSMTDPDLNFDLIDYLKVTNSNSNSRKKSLSLEKSKSRTGTLTLIDTLDTNGDKSDTIVSCICSGSKTRSDSDSEDFLTFDLIGKDPIMVFEITGMTPLDDFDTFYFEATYEFLPAVSTSSSSSLWTLDWNCLTTGQSFSGRSADHHCIKLSTIQIVSFMIGGFIFLIIVSITLLILSKRRQNSNVSKMSVNVTPTNRRNNTLILSEDIDEMRTTTTATLYGNMLKQQNVNDTPMKSLHDYNTGISYKLASSSNPRLDPIQFESESGLISCNYSPSFNVSNIVSNNHDTNQYISTLTSSRSSQSNCSRRSSAGKSIIEHYQLPIYSDLTPPGGNNGRVNGTTLDTFHRPHLPEVFTTSISRRQNGSGQNQRMTDMTRTRPRNGNVIGSPVYNAGAVSYLKDSPTSTIVTNGSSSGSSSYGHANEQQRSMYQLQHSQNQHLYHEPGCTMNRVNERNIL